MKDDKDPKPDLQIEPFAEPFYPEGSPPPKSFVLADDFKIVTPSGQEIPVAELHYPAGTLSLVRDRTIDMLNRLVGTNEEVLHQLFETRVPLTPAQVDTLEASDTDVVYSVEEDGSCALGVLGIINGILGTNHKICGVYETEPTLRLTHFKAVT